ncbi:unnamed protein product [Ectocarpus sp. CCAP 1310/34]|nr:unnamed protein product [Ectocarpus sp. CCAP 1310/34]
MFVRAPRVDVARMLRCRCSIRRRCSQPEQNATRPAPFVHALVAVLPSRFRTFSLIALKVLGLKKIKFLAPNGQPAQFSSSLPAPSSFDGEARLLRQYSSL